MRFVRLFLILLLAALLTVVIQVGGLIYLVCLPLFSWVNRRRKPGLARAGVKLALFIGVYLLSSFLIVPLLAARFGRVPMPLRSTEAMPVRPLNFLTCLLNRHYVRPPLKALVAATAQSMQQKYSGTTIAYLDAGFPFWNRFPLFPHLSHHDGKKLDLAFFYLDAQTNQRIHGNTPSWLGYGVCEVPRPGEPDRPATCAQQGYWQYGLLQKLVPQPTHPSLTFDPVRTRELARILATHPQVGKIFIEPHLKIRLKLGSYAKIRLHGCQAVRHDDHLHVQLP